MRKSWRTQYGGALGRILYYHIYLFIYLHEPAILSGYFAEKPSKRISIRGLTAHVAFGE